MQKFSFAEAMEGATMTTIYLFAKPETRQEKYLTGLSTMTTATTIYLFPATQTRQEKYLTGLSTMTTATTI
ncbi:MAG: hypothetical protein PHT77_11020, partial [Bacteroidales bacterium]|nr:hypothetical protein [Bacteroidales bacterium]